MNSVKFVHNSEIDTVKWDACVFSSETELFSSASYFLNCIHPNWHGIIINDYESVFPIIQNNKLGINYLMQPYFTQQLGLVGKHEEDIEILDLCLDECKQRYKYVECNLNYLNQTHKYKTNCVENISIRLDLSKKSSHIQDHYSKNLKRNLAKAQVNKLSIINNVKPQAIIDLFMNNKGKELTHINSIHYSSLEKALNKMRELDVVELIGVENEQNQLLAAVAFVRQKNSRFFFFSGLNELGKDMFAMPFLINYFIEMNSGKVGTLDFNGSNIKSLARFYKSFGGVEYVYLRLILNGLPWPLKLFKK